MQFYESTNLTSWKYTGEFNISRFDPGTVWECPDLVKLTIDNISTWVLIVNVNPGGFQITSGVRYFIGNFDGNTFTADDPSRMDEFLDYGPDFYAITSFF